VDTLAVFMAWFLLTPRNVPGRSGRLIGMRAAHLRMLGLAAAVAATAGLLAACGSPQARVSPSAPTASAPSTRGAPGTTGAPIAAPAPTLGLLPAPGWLADRLVLERTYVTSGTPIKGTLVVINQSRTPVNLTRVCPPKYTVVLTNREFPPDAAFAEFPPDAAFAADCLGAPFVIAPGENRLAVTVQTTYLACTQSEQATRRIPACIRGGQPPPLPAGRYEAVLVGSELRLPPPAPVPVILTAAPAR